VWLALDFGIALIAAQARWRDWVCSHWRCVSTSHLSL